MRNIQNKFSPVLQDIALAMRDSLCNDWLLLESIGQKGSRVVTCGDLQQKKKSLDTKSQQIVMHFHSTRQLKNDHKLLRGFRAQITSNSDLLHRTVAST